jgi:branched-chain amino acid transport system permease protein
MITQLLINGLVLSLMIALMSVGMTLVFGILRVVNFAHGEFYMFGAVIAFFAINKAGMGYIEASILAIATVGLMGWVANRLVFRRFHGKLIEGCIAAVALSIGFQQVGWIIFGPKQKILPAPLTGSVKIFGASVTAERLLLIGVSLAVIFGLAWLIRFTKLGKSMRAVQQDSEAALTLGISVKWVAGLTFAIATALAALAGTLMGTVYNVSPIMGMLPLTFAFIVIVVGGMGSVMGALLAALIIGFQHSLTSTFWGPQFALGLSLALAILVLILRPRGLMGNA